MSEILSQKTMPWGNHLLGFSAYYIHAKGCLITELAEAIGVTPDEINDALKAVGGYAAPATDPDNKCLVIWAKVEEAFPGIHVQRVWSYDNDQVLRELSAGNSVLVEVPAAPIGGAGSHWVRYVGDHKLHDPWTGTERPTSDFPNPTGYAVVIGKREEPQAETEPIQPEVPAQPETPPVGEKYQGLDITNVKSVKAAIDTWHDVVTGHYVTSEQYVDFVHQVCEALEIPQTTEINTVVQNIKTLKADFKSQVLVATNLPQAEQIEGQGPASQPIAVPEATLKNVPDAEKNALLAEVLKIEDSVKKLLGL